MCTLALTVRTRSPASPICSDMQQIINSPVLLLRLCHFSEDSRMSACLSLSLCLLISRAISVLLSFGLFTSLSTICLSIYLLSICLFLSVCLAPYLPLSLCPTVCMSLYLTTSLSVYLTLCLFFFLSLTAFLFACFF